MAKVEDELKDMDDGLRRLKIEYHIFFNGNRKKPPEDLRLRLERLAKQLSERGMTPAQRFHYNTLLTRYYTYRNLWRRLMREREQGKDTGKAASNSTSPSSDKERNPSVERFLISVADPKTEEDKVKSLYEAFLRQKKENSEKSTLSYPQFAQYLAKQTHQIRQKYGCTRVAYSVALEGGIVRFTASADKP
jgi:hypothetical protein